MVQEKDRPILMYLQDIDCCLHEEGYGFDLVFKFEKNDYFTDLVLKKSFTMSKQNVIEKCEGTEISWKEGRDVTKKKIKKKSKSKKAAQKTVTKIVEQESFFNFFKTLEMPDEATLMKEKDGGAKDNEKDEEDKEKDIGEKMDIDFDLGNDFKDQLIPLALEYYMEVIDDQDEEGDDGECGSDDEDDHHHQHHQHKGGKKDEDSDEDDKPAAKKKKTGKKKEAAEGAAGGNEGDQKECK